MFFSFVLYQSREGVVFDWRESERAPQRVCKKIQKRRGVCAGSPGSTQKGGKMKHTSFYLFIISTPPPLPVSSLCAWRTPPLPRPRRRRRTRARRRCVDCLGGGTCAGRQRRPRPPSLPPARRRGWRETVATQPCAWVAIGGRQAGREAPPKATASRAPMGGGGKGVGGALRAPAVPQSAECWASCTTARSP
jgi:hypothetical protein